jgi:hypothetical protein
MKYWMGLHAISFWIQFKFNLREMVCKLVEMVLKKCLWIWCWIFLKDTIFKICLSIPLFTHEWYKQIVVLKCQSDDLQPNLFYLIQL